MRRLFPYVAAMALALPSHAQQITVGPRNPTICATGISAGNGSDLTEDVMRRCTIPAGTWQNVGDSVRFTLSGFLGGTTDVKAVQVRAGDPPGGVIMTTMNASTAGQTRWWAEVTMTKSGTNTQSFGSLGTVLNGTIGGTSSGPTTLTDTVANDIVITGKNSTNSVANSVTVQTLVAEFIPAAPQ